MSEPGANAQSARGSGIAQAADGGVATVNITQVYQAAAPAAIAPQEMAAATTRLQELPLDVVPAPAGLPPGSWMPLRRNALFVGREADLGTLASALKEGGTAAVGQSTAVTGLGGIGKSQLASEFAYRYGQYFAGGVFWLGCEDPNAIPAEIATCGRNLNLHADFTNLPLDGQVSLVASAWHGELPRLLIFDNCEDERVLETWLPRGGGCRVLATSRRNIWSLHLGVRGVSLGVLARSESLALLRKHRPDLAPDDPLSDAIAAELGDLPLALHLAGSFLARYRHAPSGAPKAYLEAVRQPDLLEHRSLTIEGASPTGHEQHVARTFALSYDRLQPADAIDEIALVTLARAAWFAPGETIPRSLLRASAGVDGADDPAALRFEDGLARLRELGLIAEEGSGALVLHRLLAAFVRSAAGDAGQHRGRVEAAVFAEAARLNAAGYPAPLLAWQPQLRFVAEQAAEAGSEHAGGLFNELGYHLRMVADFAGARAAFERALRIDEASFGPDHPEVAADVNNLGRVLKDLGDLPGARAAFERALRIDEASFGPGPPQRRQPTSTTWATCCGSRAIWRAPGWPSSGRCRSSRSTSGLSTPSSPHSSTTWAWCCRSWTIWRAPGRPSSGRLGSARRASGPITPTLPSASTTWAGCCRPWAIWRAPGRPSSGRSGSTRRASGPTTRRSRSTSTTWARCCRTWAIWRAPGRPSSGRWRSASASSGRSIRTRASRAATWRGSAAGDARRRRAGQGTLPCHQATQVAHGGCLQLAAAADCE